MNQGGQVDGETQQMWPFPDHLDEFHGSFRGNCQRAFRKKGGAGMGGGIFKNLEVD